MSYQVIRTEKGQPGLILKEEPPYCHALMAAPQRREPELNVGRWLVMAFAAWSVPDIGAIQTALDAIKRFNGLVNLGLRPCDDPGDHMIWCPELGNDGNTPCWVLLDDGTVRLTHGGLQTVDGLIDAIRTIFPGIREVNEGNVT